MITTSMIVHKESSKYGMLQSSPSLAGAISDVRALLTIKPCFVTNCLSYAKGALQSTPRCRPKRNSD